MAHNRAINPGWEYRFYDHREIVAYLRQHLGETAMQLCDRVNPRYGVVLADLFRYLVILREGGVYLDVKGHLSAPLDTIIRADDVYLLSQWRNQVKGRDYGIGLYPELSRLTGGELQQWHVIAAPRHPFLVRAINGTLANMADYCPDWHGRGKLGVLRVSGPIGYSMALGPCLRRYAYRLIDAESVGLHYTAYSAFYGHQVEIADHYSLYDEPVMLPGDTAADTPIIPPRITV